MNYKYKIKFYNRITKKTKQFSFTSPISFDEAKARGYQLMSEFLGVDADIRGWKLSSTTKEVL